MTTTPYSAEPTTAYRPPPPVPPPHPAYVSSSHPTTSLTTAKNNFTTHPTSHAASHAPSNYEENNYRTDTRTSERDYENYDNYNQGSSARGQYSSDGNYYNEQYDRDSYDYHSESNQSSHQRLPERYPADNYPRTEDPAYQGMESRAGYNYDPAVSDRNAYAQPVPPVTVGNMPPPPGMEPVTLPSATQPPPPGTVTPEISDAAVPAEMGYVEGIITSDHLG